MTGFRSKPAQPRAPLDIRRRWPAGKEELLLRAAGSFEGCRRDTTDVDNAASGVSAVPRQIRSSGSEMACFSLTIETPPMGDQRVTIVDQATGKPTSAMVPAVLRDSHQCIQVGKKRFWNRKLDEIDALAHATIPVIHRGN